MAEEIVIENVYVPDYVKNTPGFVKALKCGKTGCKKCHQRKGFVIEIKKKEKDGPKMGRPSSKETMKCPHKSDGSQCEPCVGGPGCMKPHEHKTEEEKAVETVLKTKVTNMVEEEEEEEEELENKKKKQSKKKKKTSTVVSTSIIKGTLSKFINNVYSTATRKQRDGKRTREETQLIRVDTKASSQKANG